MRVLFWGTPEFAVPPLRALLGEGFDVTGVVTQPDKPVGRSRSQLEPPPVKAVAVEEQLRVLQPEKPRGEEFMNELRALEPDLSVVVAYGHILPKAVIDLPRLGTWNIHASLLPQLRGAAPIQGAILDGLSETGVSIMQMVPALDAGPVLHTATTPILEDETAGELTLRLSEMGALALIEALALHDFGKLEPRPQDDALATYAPKIDRESTRIDWRREATAVCRTIRAYDPRPGALTTLHGADVKVYGARPVADATEGREPGTVLTIDGDGMLVACGSGGVRIAAVQPAGKRRLSPREWANGRGIAPGDRLGS